VGIVTGRFTSILAESIYSGSYVYLDEVERQAYINEPWILERCTINLAALSLMC
jgi:hypothetical protein